MAGHYELTRLNAVKHGILSKEVVLPHESRDEYDKLLDQMTAEFMPSTMTEQTLVEELTNIVWRKNRLLLAENAQINRGLLISLQSPGRISNTSSPLDFHIDEENVDVKGLLRLNPNELKYKADSLKVEEEKRQKAQRTLSEGGRNCTRRAAESLGEMLLNLWYSTEDYENSRNGLAMFLDEKARLVIEETEKVISHIEEIRKQALGTAINQVSFDSFARYETHLDRKYERTLAMLIKLKSMSMKHQEPIQDMDL